MPVAPFCLKLGFGCVLLPVCGSQGSVVGGTISVSLSTGLSVPQCCGAALPLGSTVCTSQCAEQVRAGAVLGVQQLSTGSVHMCSSACAKQMAAGAEIGAVAEVADLQYA